MRHKWRRRSGEPWVSDLGIAIGIGLLVGVAIVAIVGSIVGNR